MPRAAAARRYAKALFQLARGQDRVAGVQGELDALAETLEQSSPLRDVLLRPLHPASARRKVLASVAERMEASPLMRSFCAYLVDQRRFVDLETIRSEYRRLADEAAGVTQARVRAASPLSEAQRSSLASALERRVGRQVELVVEVDPSLIGGLVAQVGDMVFDGSLRTQLRQLRASLG